MIGNTIIYKDSNNNEIIGRIIDKILWSDNIEIQPATAYLVQNNINTSLTIAYPSQIKKVL
jgi:hypothetical protein